MPTKKAKRRSPKPTKKITKKANRPAKRYQPTTALAVVSLSEIQKPEMYKGKMSLIPTLFTPTQLKAIVSPTPKQIILNRPGKGGGKWDYVPGWWFKKKANFVFGFMHSFTILKTEVIGEFITVTGRVTIRDPKTGNVLIEKDDFGGAQIKYLKGTKTPLDIGNDFKAAQTDAFKRCMVQFGFAMDVYGKGESLDAGQDVNNDDPTGPVPQATVAKVTVVDNSPIDIEYECRECAEPVSKDVADYSKKFFKGKIYCRNCQKQAKEGIIR